MKRTMLGIALVVLVALPAAVLCGAARMAPAGVDVSASAGKVIRSSLGGAFESQGLARRYAPGQSDDAEADPQANPIECAYGLQACYPNPFNPTTTVAYRLREDSNVELVVFDVSGRRVRTLAAGKCESGHLHQVTWDGTNDTGTGLPSGVYLMRLATEESVQTRKVVLLK